MKYSDNYNGLCVPSGYGAIFRGMAEDARLSAECTATTQEWIRLNTAKEAQKTINELNIIKDNHLSAFNSKVLHKIASQIDDPIITNNLLNKNVSIPINSPSILGVCLLLKDTIRTPNLFVDYNQIYNYISHPFSVVSQELSAAKSEIEVNFKKHTFLTNLNHLNKYFEYAEGGNNQSPIPHIKCKESLLETVEDISSKITGFNKIVVIPERAENSVVGVPTHTREKDHNPRDNNTSERENSSQKKVTPESEEDLMAIIEQLRASV